MMKPDFPNNPKAALCFEAEAETKVGFFWRPHLQVFHTMFITIAIN
jgi:hypothetical protein